MEEHFIDCAQGIALDCCRCGEKLLLLGEEDDWRSRNAIFRCHCGESLTLEERTEEEEVLKIEEFVHALRGTTHG